MITRKTYTEVVLLSALRVFLGLLFSISGVGKLVHFLEFISAVESYGILPLPMVGPFAVMVTAVEILMGIMLVLNRGVRQASSILMFLLSLFLFAIVNSLIAGNNNDCGCFIGVYREPVSLQAIIRNILLIGLLLVLTIKSNEGLKNNVNNLKS